MMDGAKFGDRLSHEDYEAIMNYARILPPSVKENYVDIAGGDSSIDLTEAVGGVVYDDGEIEFKFTLKDRAKKEEMKNDLHGKRMQIVLEREPEYYYDGRIRCTKEEWKKGLYELYFSAKVKPYKCELIHKMHTEIVSGSKEIILQNTRMPAIPQITVTGSIVLVYEGMKYNMEEGVYQIPEITFFEGKNIIKVSGTGSVKFQYRRGQLI